MKYKLEILDSEGNEVAEKFCNVLDHVPAIGTNVVVSGVCTTVTQVMYFLDDNNVSIICQLHSMGEVKEFTPEDGWEGIRQ